VSGFAGVAARCASAGEFGVPEGDFVAEDALAGGCGAVPWFCAGVDAGVEPARR
jgi:hypothetical protein